MTSLVSDSRGGLLADLRQSWSQPVSWSQVPQSPVAQLPNQALPVRHLALAVVPLQDGHHLREQADELGALDVAVLLQLGDEAHEGGGVGRVLRAQRLELGAQESQRQFARSELQC